VNEAGSSAQSVELRWDSAREPAELMRLAEELLAGCDARLRETVTDWIGHVKVLIATLEGAAYASLTGAGEPITWAGTLKNPAAQATVSLYAVVWGVSDEVVARAVEEAIGG